ncbi:B12-binding domain-containing protein [Erythrobacter sp. THAF29]|uniref:cobalamin B12-binding domain-containing protein n=1 Tax=Erythrobacter sp. THAF29 TaxID=2587851 RepID=UPI0012678778|nr:cobalamin-dependent protein [Erythrobacter sp. THAF29]QFT78637.1 B12 binding domain protein [Erythrobacter sp. THAF29]
MAGPKGTGVMGAGSAALRKVIIDPFARKKPRSADNSDSPGPLADESINAIIEGEIIPRLLMAHSSSRAAAATSRSGEIDPSDASRFASLPLRLEAASLLEEVDSFLDAGVSVEAVYLDLLAPAARRLGEMWISDDCDFVDVTMGLWRLQQVMREISARTPPAASSDREFRPTAIFAPIPGDQHSFGALMIDEVFSRAGWDSVALSRPERRELLDLLSKKSFDVAGLTISRDCPSAAVANLIKAMRSVSANPHICVLIGGRAVNEDPSIVATVGADGTGADARAALEEAERLVASSPVRARTMR